MKKGVWVIEKIPKNFRKREYLYYLLEVSGFGIHPVCRNPEKGPRDLLNFTDWNDNLTVQILRIGKDSPVLKSIPKFSYKEAIQLLEKQLNIKK